MIPLIPLIASATVATSSAAFSLDASELEPVVKAEEDRDVEEIVVTGSRTEKRLADAPVATEVISRREIIASGAANLGDVLDKHPGVEVDRSTAGASVRLEGLDGDRVLFLIDGERVTGHVRKGVDPTRFDAESIDHVEIVKGPSCALYGSEAIGGVINVITRKINRPFEAELYSAYGSANTLDLSGGAGGAVGGLRTHFNGGFHRSDGFDRNPESFDGFDVSNRTDYTLSPGTVFKARAEYRLINQNAVDLRPPRAIFDRTQNQETVEASLGPVLNLEGPSKLSLSLHYSRFRLQILQEQRGDASVPPEYQDDRQQIGQLTIQYDRLLFARHLVTIGGDGLLEAQDVDFLKGANASRRRGAVFLQDEWTLLDRPNELVLVPGVRADLDSQFGTRVSPKLALRFDPGGDVVIRAGAGVGFRAPAFEELYLDFQNPGSGYRVDGNPNLSPETAIGVNAGVEWNAARSVQFSVSGFYNDIENLIDTQRTMAMPGELNRFTYVNVASARTDGIEAGAHFSLLSRLELDLRYAYTDTRDRALGRSLPGRARHRGTVRLGWRERSLGLEASARAAIVGTRLYLQDANGQEVSGDPYAAIDLRIAKDLFDHFTLFAGIDNLLDAGDAILLPIAPRSFYAGLMARYALDGERADNAAGAGPQ